MIVVENLSKSYDEEQVLNGVNLEIEDGDIFGIIGQSGAGKSTILRCLNGTEKIQKGRIIVDGNDISKMNIKEIRNLRRNMGFIFQHFSLTERDTVSQNIAIPMKCWKFDKKYIQDKIDELLRVVDLESKRDKKPRELSGGQKQRVAIARALSMEPRYLLCDEATSALDPKTTKSILKLLQKINEQSGVTIIIVTHEMSVIREICNKVAVIDNGEVAVTGRVEDVFLNENEALKRLTGEETYEDLPSEGTNIKLKFSNSSLMNETLNDLIKTLQLDITILSAKTEKYRDNALGEVLINVQDQDYDKILGYLGEKDVKWEALDV